MRWAKGVVNRSDQDFLAGMRAGGEEHRPVCHLPGQFLEHRRIGGQRRSGEFQIAHHLDPLGAEVAQPGRILLTARMDPREAAENGRAAQGARDQPAWERADMRA